MPARAAEELVLQLDGLALPIDLVALESWSRQPEQAGNGLQTWLTLLDSQSRRDLVRLLQAPLLRDRSFGLQLLNSWTGEQMLKEAGSLLTTGPAGRSTAPLLLSSLRQLLERQSSVSALELLRALPVASVTLRLDGALQLAEQWRSQLQRQNSALVRLRQLPLPSRSSSPLGFTSAVRRQPQRLQLPVPHRVAPLPLELWPGRLDTLALSTE